LPNQHQGELQAVHQAMAEARLEKQAVRNLWLERAIYHSEQAPDLKDTLYLTLSGAEGAEFSLLIDAGLLKTTEVNSIEADYLRRVIAIEQNHAAYIQLQSKFPGLQIIRNTVEQLLHGNTRTRFPENDRLRICRSRIVNLDLNQAWSPYLIEGQWIVPVARWIEKFAEMHAVAPQVPWSLFLTLHGECPWRAPASEVITDEIRVISTMDNAIKEKLESWITTDVCTQILQNAIENYSSFRTELQQRLLMWLVPSVIIHDCATKGWAISIRHNLHYGRHPEHAPMVTWVIDFNVPERQARNYQHEFLAGLKEVLNTVGYIDAQGNTVYY
jgi:hypothetical protein